MWTTVEKRLCEYLVVGGFPEAQGSGKRPLDRTTCIALLQGVEIRGLMPRDAILDRNTIVGRFGPLIGA